MTKEKVVYKKRLNNKLKESLSISSDPVNAIITVPVIIYTIVIVTHTHIQVLEVSCIR